MSLTRNGPILLCMVSVGSALCACFAPVHVQGVVFTDVTRSAGIDVVHNTASPGLFHTMSGGAAAGDYDRDGWIDLYVTRYSGPDRLYRNLGNGTFADVTPEAFARQAIDPRTNGPAWGDIDNDGDLDLYVTTWGGPQNYLFINDGGIFREESILRGAAVDAGARRTAMSAAFGDYDRDGYLDLYTTEWMDRPGPRTSRSRLLRNRGGAQSGHFEDVTEAAGVDLSIPAFTFAPRFTDLDRDGHPDLALASDYGYSRLFWNNGNGTFTDGTESSGANQDGSAMGSAVGDYDNDGDLDWFLGNIDVDRNNLYANQLSQGTARTFRDLATETGVVDSDWSWGSSFLDFDNDSYLDLVVTNGAPVSEGTDYAQDPIYLFRNLGPDGQGEFGFADVSPTSFAQRDTRIGSGLVVFDYDNDGDQDIFVVNAGQYEPSILYRNDGGDRGSYLRVETHGTESNRDGIGAWVTVTPDLETPENRRVWEINGGSNFLGQNELTAHFGWSDRTDPLDLVQIDWPSGIQQQFRHVELNTTLVAIEPLPEPLTGMVVWTCACLAVTRCFQRRIARKESTPNDCRRSSP